MNGRDFDLWSLLVENIVSEHRRSSPEYFNAEIAFVLVQRVKPAKKILNGSVFDLWSSLVENIVSEQRRSIQEYFNAIIAFVLVQRV